MRSNKVNIINKMAPVLKELAEIYCKYADEYFNRTAHLSVDVWCGKTADNGRSIGIDVRDNNDKDVLRFAINPLLNTATYEVNVDLEV